nr:helix-turn-helix transcriptional regulator [Enterococcus faecalis]
MEKNLSQVELSSILLVSRQTISNWENGRTRPEMEI